jgi:signal transduction histidine kinase
LDEVLTDALDKTLDLMEIEAGGIYLLDEAAGVLTVAVHHGFSPEFVARIDQLKLGEGFSGRVAQSGRPLVIKDVSADPRLTRMVVREEGLRSLTSVPLSSKGRVLGTLFAVTHGYREFTDQNVELLTAIGHQIAVAIENARLFEAEQRRAEEFRVIGEVGRRITSILAVDELLGQMASLIKEAFGYYGVGIGLIEGENVVFRAGAGSFWDDPEFQPISLRVGYEGVTGWVAETGQPLLVPDVSQEPRYHQMSLEQARNTRSELAVPMRAKGTVVGVLDVESDRLGAFDAGDLAVLQSLANQAAIAIENARLYEQAQQLAALEERQRLARELHDAVTQTLFSASLIAEALPDIWSSDPAEGRQLLTEIRRLSRGALAEMRTLLLELRPAALVEASLEGLVRQLAEAFTGRTGVYVTTTVEGRCALPADVHVALYRIAQEALNNVAKHADASQVTVSLLHSVSSSSEDGWWRVGLRITDDGCGFAPGAVPPNCLGLGIMRERAQAVGAVLEVVSRPRMGTQVSVEWVGKKDEQDEERDVEG